MKKIILIYFILIYSLSVVSQIKIDSDFENGNVEIVEISDSLNTITILPSLENEANTTRCWFYFKIYNYNIYQPLTIKINYDKSVMAPNNPVYSYNQKDWIKITSYQQEGCKTITGFFSGDTIYFATGFPYTYSDLNTFLSKIENSKDVTISTLTLSENNNIVPKIFITDKSIVDCKYVIWIIARQHAFESQSNFILEGIINFLNSDDKEARKLRKICEIHIIPMMDVDNVIIGASGRMQNPVDFNRDWNVMPHWNAVKKTIAEINESIENKPYSIFFDIHSTYPGGISQLFSYFDIYMKSPESENMQKFWDLYQELADFRPIKLSGAEKTKGYIWADQYSGNRNCPDSTNSCFRTEDFSLTLECEWNKKPDGEQWTIEDLTKTGEHIANALCKYMLEKPKLTD
jgi:hypothetical protein